MANCEWTRNFSCSWGQFTCISLESNVAWVRRLFTALYFYVFLFHYWTRGYNRKKTGRQNKAEDSLGSGWGPRKIDTSCSLRWETTPHPTPACSLFLSRAWIENLWTVYASAVISCCYYDIQLDMVVKHNNISYIYTSTSLHINYRFSYRRLAVFSSTFLFVFWSHIRARYLPSR